MITPDQITKFKELLDSAKTVFIFFSKTDNFDIAVSVLTLFNSLLVKGDKDLMLFCPQIPEYKQDWPVFKSAKTQIGNQNLQISFAYEAEAVDRVSYNIDEITNRFVLLIQPQKGKKPLDYKSVEYAYTGAEADLIILWGVNNYEELGQLYQGYETVFTDSSIISVNNYETEIGNLKLNISGQSCFSQAVFDLLDKLALSVSSDDATFLLSAIDQITAGFSSLSATADTFETAAKLMRLGARRVRHQAQTTKILSQAMAKKSLSGELKPTKEIKKIEVGKKKKSESKKIGGLDYQPGEGIAKG